VGYGLSLVLFVKSLRTLGAARGGAVFIVCALVVGVLASALFLGERLSAWTPVAGVLVVVGVLLAASTPKGSDPAA
jgi:drug/metabolite transporter (DMT)-like permease